MFLSFPNTKFDTIFGSSSKYMSSYAEPSDNKMLSMKKSQKPKKNVLSRGNNMSNEIDGT